MHNTYGYIRGTQGADKDHIDVYLSDDPTHSDKVFIVQQRKKVNGAWNFDELKVLLGFDDAAQASNAYLSNYEEGWDGMQAIIETDIDSFKEWLKNGNQKGTYKEDGAWAKVYPGVSDMVADEGEMPEPEQQEVQVLRREGNNRLPGMGGELSEVPGGHGQATISQNDTGQNRREQGVLQGELQVDGLDNPVSEPKDSPLSDIQGENNVNATVGSRNGSSTEENKIQNPDIPLERRENTGNSGRDQGQLQNDNLSGQNDENGRLGEGTQSELQNAEDEDKARLDNGKNSQDSNSHKANGNVENVGERESLLRDAIVALLRSIGIKVSTDWKLGQKILDEYNGKKLLSRSKKRAIETAPLNPKEGSPADISTADGAKIQKNLESYANNLEKVVNRRKNFISEVAQNLGAKQDGSDSWYRTFTTPNGLDVTFRLGNHNATVSNFDFRDEDNGISIVVSKRSNEGMKNDGNAHIVEFFYPEIALRKAYGKPLAEIVRSIKDAISTGEYKDSTGLAEREEVNADEIKQQKADVVDMYAKNVDISKPIEDTVAKDPTASEAMAIKERVEDMSPAELIENYRRINSQMLEEDGMTVDEHEEKVKREYIEKNGLNGLGKAMADHLHYLSDKYGYGKLSLRWDLLDRINELGLEEYANSNKPYDPSKLPAVPENSKATVVDMHGRPMFFKTPDGYAYGYTYRGKIYLDPRIATSETPIHEYGHLWAEMKRQTNPEEWNHIKEVMLNDKLVQPIIDRVKRDYPELAKEGKEDGFVEEVITQFSGKRGNERLREIANEIAEERGGIFGKAEAVTAMQRLKNILNRFWEGVANMMGWKYKNANQIADKILSDMLNGVNPTEKVRENEQQHENRRQATMDAVQGRDDIMFQKVPERKPYNLSETKKDAEGNRMYEREGSIDLWTATPLLAKARRQQAPVRLSERNMNHIISRHSDKLDTEDKVFDFLDNVFANAKILRRAKGRGMFVVVESENTDRAAIIKLMPSEDGDYYNIDSAGFYRKDKWKESEEVIADLSEPSQSDAVSDASKPQAPNDNGREPINAETQNSSSEGKDTKNSDTFQGNEGKSSDEGQENENNSLKFREGEAQQVELGAGQRESYIERKTRNAVNAVRSMAQQMGLDVEVLTTTDGLTGKKARAKGWFNAKTGKITLVLPNHSNQFDLVNTLLHEGVAHYGLRKMFGQNFDTFLDNIYNNVSPEIKARIDAAMKRNGWDRHEATEEYLARLAERTDFDNAMQQGWWNKIKEFFMNMLVKAGFNTVLTDNELRYILWRSYDNLLHPDSRRNIFDIAKDVEMKRKLGIRRERERERLQRTGMADTSWMAAEAIAYEDTETPELFSIRTKEPPKKTGKGYKVFVLKDGQLYPPMVANPNGEGTPIGVWLDADAAPVAGTSKTGRPQVKAGGKGTQGGSGQLAYRPGWHLGTIPYALQFNRKDASGEKTLFPNNFVWAEVEYADDVDYQDEARHEGINANGKYQHSLAGLKHIPTDGSYKYRTNPDPRTDEWIITGAMRVNKILSREEVDELVRKAGREPQPMQEGDVLTKEAIDELNAEIKTMKEADEMGLLYRDDYDGFFVDDIAQHAYERAVASDSIKWQEAWQDSMAGLKAIQDAIAKETGNVATGAEDAYHFENRMHGRAKNMAERYDWQYYRPMLKAFNDFCKAKGLTHEQGLDYLIAKSGLERNMYYAFRDSMKEKLTESIKKEREKLEKDYAKKRIDEAEYKRLKAELEDQERTGVDDAIQQLHETLAWQRAKEDYEHGDITFDEFLRRRESLIRGVVGNLYDNHVKDYSGLTETFAKMWYDDAQAIRKDAQQAIDPTEKRMLWSAYNKAMDEAYKVAYQVAVDDVFGAEDGAVKFQTELWEKINAATKETLKHSYESGLMERKTYQKVGSMFDYYLPLRGWDEDKASDVYTYMGKDNVFSPAVKKTWGRTSKSENPLAYIGNIAVSTILSGHRNLMKQHFLNYVMNNPTSLVNISESWYENIGYEGESPVWVLRTADTAGKSADEIVDIVNDFNEEMRLKQNEGKAMPVTGRLRLDVHATSGQKAEHVVEVQRAGHTYQLYINGDPKAAQALNGSAARAVSRISDTWLGRRITSINRSMAEFFTSKNPAFIISNLSRDLNMAGASVAVNEGAEYNARFIANAAKVLSPRVATGDVSKMGLLGLVGRGRGVTGMMPKLMRKYQDGKLNTRNETERYFKEFMEEGGETGFVNMLSVDSFKEKMRKEVAQMNGSSLFGSKNVKEVSVTKALRLLGETFEFYNRCAEDATRFIVYMTSRQMGKTLEESIADAKDVTLNFNRKGTGEKGNAELRDLFIFVNPAIQALANMYRMAKGHPLKLGGVAAGFMLMGVFMPVLNQWLLNMFGDDDDKDAYWNLPPWVRKNNLVFWVPGTKYFFTMPLAQEFRVFYGVGEMISSGVMEHPHQNTGVEIIESVADLVPINPMGNGGNLVINFLPTTTQPILQVAFNTDFTGKPIWKDNMGNKYDPMFTKAYASTPKWMTKVSEGINLATGGDEDSRGWLDKTAAGQYLLNNPAVWNHLLQGYLGGMYNTIAKSADVIVTVANQEVPNAYQVPILNRFINSPWERDNSGALGEDYWQMINDNEEFLNNVRKKKKRAKAGDAEAQKKLDKLMASDEYQQSLVINQYKKLIDGLRKQQKEATDKDTLAKIKSSISMYKNDLLDEIAALESGKDPLELAIGKFDATEDAEKRKAIALRISKEAGASETPYGDKPKNDHQRIYQELRTGEDVYEDALLLAYQQQLGAEGKEQESKDISSQRKQIHSSVEFLFGGKGDQYVMKGIRTARKAMIKRLKLNKKAEKQKENKQQ